MQALFLKTTPLSPEETHVLHHHNIIPTQFTLLHPLYHTHSLETLFHPPHTSTLVLISSRNAVQALRQYLEKVQQPIDLSCFEYLVVGKKTNDDLVQVVGKGGVKVADNMAQMAEFIQQQGQTMKDRPLFYLLGDKADSLAKYGVQAQEILSYSMTSISQSQFDSFCSHNQIDQAKVIVYYSGSNLESFLKMLENSEVEFRLESKWVIALGPKAFNHMAELGVKIETRQVRVCCSPSLEEVIRQIKSLELQ